MCESDILYKPCTRERKRGVGEMTKGSCVLLQHRFSVIMSCVTHRVVILQLACVSLLWL